MKSLIPNRLDIILRPMSADLRNEFGHFEADSIEGIRAKNVIVNGDNNSNNNNRNNNKQKRHSCLTVLVDRKTRLTKIKKTASKTAQATTKSIVTALKPYSNTIKSITYDNGCEFSRHEEINKILNTKSYYCKPYASYEKGTVENINGLIRRFFLKELILIQ